MKRHLLAVALLLVLGGSALATCVVRRRAVVVKKVAVVTPAVAVFSPVAVAVPAYGAAYAPPAATAQADLKAVLDALKAIDARLKALESGVRPGPVIPPRAVPAADGEAAAPAAPLALFQAKCARCHEAKVSATAGGGFTLLSGDALAPLNDRQLRKIGTMTYSGKMPKGDKLSDQAVGTIQEWLDSK
jgi:mono/diheme cytochrome c family protein